MGHGSWSPGLPHRYLNSLSSTWQVVQQPTGQAQWEGDYNLLGRVDKTASSILYVTAMTVRLHNHDKARSSGSRTEYLTNAKGLTPDRVIVDSTRRQPITTKAIVWMESRDAAKESVGVTKYWGNGPSVFTQTTPSVGDLELVNTELQPCDYESCHILLVPARRTSRTTCPTSMHTTSQSSMRNW